VQILADSYGNIIHLGTRDCSIQRRHQKLLEVAPVDLPGSLTEEIHNAAIVIARTSSYENAGTVEFLVDVQTGRFWFMEINPRLQVEHSVTEMLTGVDIVKQQILIAEGKMLRIRQDQVNLSGVAIEVRINAEDPKKDFMPEAGKIIEIFDQPEGYDIRVDGNINWGYQIPTTYDSLLAKLIVRGHSWEDAVQLLSKALSQFMILGLKTTIPLYIAICNETDFKNRKFDIAYLEKHPQVFSYHELEHYVIDNVVYSAYQHRPI
jgi:acetyl/propionyl-CoA carboxylase alpha subunit